MCQTVYLQISDNIEVNKKHIYLKDIADVYCRDTQLCKSVKEMEVYQISNEKKARICMSVLYVIAALEKSFQNVQFCNLGSTDFVIDYIEQKQHSKVIQNLCIVLASVFICIGSAYAIVAYNNDVNVSEIFNKLYDLFGIYAFSQYHLLEIGYAIGMLVGILVFYNHFPGKDKDPTPLAVEMDKSNKEITDTLLTQSEQNGTKRSVSG